MSSEKLQLTFQKFAELLDTRFSKDVFTKEDSIRYTFFYATCLELGLDPEKENSKSDEEKNGS